jgi:hypothetical protein
VGTECLLDFDQRKKPYELRAPNGARAWNYRICNAKGGLMLAKGAGDIRSLETSAICVAPPPGWEMRRALQFFAV